MPKPADSDELSLVPPSVRETRTTRVLHDGRTDAMIAFYLKHSIPFISDTWMETACLDVTCHDHFA